jgi:ribonuclease P protein component
MEIKNCRLYKSEIVRKRTEFKAVFASTHVMSSPSLTLRWTQNPTRKIGFIVTKDVAQKAVLRNRIKRQLREIYRTNKDSFSENNQYVVQARKLILTKSFDEVKEDFLSLARKTNEQK